MSCFADACDQPSRTAGRAAFITGQSPKRTGLLKIGLQAQGSAAYAAGEHRSRMDQSRDGSVFDYSSFTRARIVAANGSWDGDPLAQMT